jgi:hypothetical protein
MYFAIFAIVFAVLTLLGMGELGTPMVASAAGLLALPIWAVVRGVAYAMGKSPHTQRTGLGKSQMTIAQRWLIVGTLCVLAMGLARHFVEYRAEDMQVDIHLNRVVPVGLILPIREGTRTSYFQSPPAAPAPADTGGDYEPASVLRRFGFTPEGKPLNEVTAAQPVPVVKPQEGFEITTEQGIYARPDYSIAAAAIGGLLVPILLLAGAGYLALGSHHT